MPASRSLVTRHPSLVTTFLVCVLSVYTRASEIHDACEAGDAGKVKALLAQRPELVDQKDSNGGATPLQIAVENGKKNVVEALVAAGADISMKNSIGWMPVHFTAGGKESADSKSCVEFVLPKDPELASKWSKEGFTPLHRYIANGDRNALKKLLAGECDCINEKDSAGWTPLHWAAVNGDKEAAKLLIGKKADTELKNNVGQTPLQAAVMLGQKEIVDILLNAKADSTDALKLSRQFLQKDVEQLLLKRGIKE
ncbi:MAG TPA: ankyrin repeat domain-containing protein [Planctomycetota bacterium]|nr:ankyrin repeat domain-containing protein [Planctomycetota bacterium]